MLSPSELTGLAEEVTPRAVDLRRRLHQIPEPAYEEHETTTLICSMLEDNGLSPNRRTPRTGLWVDLGGEPRVGFRADLDALPIFEPTGNIPRSRNEGWMHACGHDAHAAIASGIALALSKVDLPIGVRILFQPAEEANPGGASEFVADGLVDDLRSLIAFHVDPSLEVGRIGSKVGPITGSADGFTITLSGPGGHTSRPHKTVNLIDAAGRVIRELPEAVRQSIDSRTPIVTVFGSVHGGSTSNVIPTEVTLAGTLRTLDRSIWDLLPGIVDKTLGQILAITGADYLLDYRQGIPPVVNNGVVVDAACSSISELLGPDTVVPTETSLGGEDFSNYLDIVPGALLRLGTYSGGGDLHSSSFKVNEASVGVGIRAGIAAISGLLSRS
jgi:amidohydrolase